MVRTVVITGAESGIGNVTAEFVERRGWRPIRVDLMEGDVCANLAATEGHVPMVERVTTLAGGRLDAVIACDGLTLPHPITLQVNYFGMVATLAGLRPLLAKGANLRAVAISSRALLMPNDPVVVAACLGGDEASSVATAEGKGEVDNALSKRALTRWIRRNAINGEWARTSIRLNAIAPGMVATPMTAAMRHDPTQRRGLNQAMPMPIGQVAHPEETAELLAWLASPAKKSCESIGRKSGALQVGERKKVIGFDDPNRISGELRVRMARTRRLVH